MLSSDGSALEVNHTTASSEGQTSQRFTEALTCAQEWTMSMFKKGNANNSHQPKGN